jgi:putative ubiquitin-RnfH superfamily antitoxin RatB of RatAB toxin-antitoxin module
MDEPAPIRVQVVLAGASSQPQVALDLPAGTSAWQAVEASGLVAGRADLDPSRLGVAIFGRLVGRGQPLEDGDRVEILRPLPQDPKQRRRNLARDGATMGRKPRSA